MNDNEFCVEVHMEIHAVRRIQNYKPNPMERNISKLVIEKFKDSCKECREIGEKLKTQSVKKGFFDKLKENMD